MPQHKFLLSNDISEQLKIKSTEGRENKRQCNDRKKS